MGNAKDRATNGLGLARTGLLLFQIDQDRLRLWWVELQDDRPFGRDAGFLGQLTIERGELAVCRIHVQPSFLRRIADTDVGLCMT